MTDYVERASQICRYKGCRFTIMQTVADGLLEVVEQTTGRKNMSQAMWCDQGGHAFSERDPGRQRISISVLDEETEQEKMESRDFCGECAKSAGLYQPRKTRPAAIVANGMRDKG